jgi:hypothetical protein
MVQFTLSPKYFDAKVAKAAGKLTDDLFEICDSWHGGSTSLYNQLWFSHFVPKSKTALANVRKGRYDLAMQSLLGMLVFFMHDGPLFLRYQELWTADEKIFCSFFSNTSKAWKGLLEKSDQELMIKENCRDELRMVVMKLQHDVNIVCDDLFRNFDDKAKLSIFTDEEMEEYDENEDEDDDEDDDQDDDVDEDE